MKTRFLIIIGIFTLTSSLISIYDVNGLTINKPELNKSNCELFAFEQHSNNFEFRDKVQIILDECVEKELITNEDIEFIQSQHRGVSSREFEHVYSIVNGDIRKAIEIIQDPNYPIIVFGSPHQQTSIGIEPENVLCKDDLELIFKSKDNSPACVKPETKIKLIERGWATTDQLENKIITPEDNDRLINIKKGESFIVKLDSSYGWRISIDNQTVVDSDYSDIRYSGSQGVYLALNSGQAILTGVGDPLCLSLDPPCMSPSILFQLNINVK